MSWIVDLIFGKKDKKTPEVFKSQDSPLFPGLYEKTLARQSEDDLAAQKRRQVSEIEQRKKEEQELKDRARVIYSEVDKMVLEVCREFAKAIGTSPEKVTSHFESRGSSNYGGGTYGWYGLGIGSLHQKLKDAHILLDYGNGKFYFRVRSEAEGWYGHEFSGEYSVEEYMTTRYSFDECTPHVTRASLIAALHKLSETL